MSQDFCRVGNTNIVVFILVVMFAISSWVDINGLWVELPILVQKLPEGWDLPSYMAVVIQVANVAPLVYTITHTICPRRNLEVPVIYTIISTGAVACLLLVFFWDTVETVAGELHSVGLLGLQFFLALVDCTSSVAYLPFMAAFQPQYLTAFYIGEGLSGLLPSLVSLAQGAGDIFCYNSTTMRNVSDDNETVTVAERVSYPVYQTPRFSIEVFFCFLLAMLLLSLLAFTLLNFWPYTKRGKADKKTTLVANPGSRTLSKLGNSEEEQDLHRTIEGLPSPTSPAGIENNNGCRSLLLASTCPPLDATGGVEDVEDDSENDSKDVGFELKKLKRHHYVLLLTLTAWVNGLSNGVLPSVQSYSCLPYGIQAYHLAITLSSIANPMACFVTLFLPAKTLRSVVILSAVGSILSSCVLYTSATSPAPPLSLHALGPFFVVTLWVLVVFVLTHAKVSMAAMFRMEGKRALLWCGAVTQVGSLVGALITFFLVNFYKLFQQAIVCR